VYSYAFPIDPKDPTKELIGCKDVEFVNGRFLQTSIDKVGLVDNYNYPDSRFMLGDGFRICDGVAISTSYKVPMEMEIPQEMIVPGVNDLTVKPAKDDPQKQELLKLIDQEIRSIFPTDKKVTVTSGNKLDKIQFLQSTSEGKDDFTANPHTVSTKDFARFIYLCRVKENMDQYTPYQAKRALKEDVRTYMEKKIFQNQVLKSLISAYQPRPGKVYSATPEGMYSAYSGYVQFEKDYSKIEKMTKQELNTYLDGIDKNIKDVPQDKLKYLVMKHEVKQFMKEREQELQKNSVQAEQVAPEKK